MLKRTFAAVMTFVAMFCFTVAGEAAASNNWLIYWYICGADLETNTYVPTRNIAEMQHVKLPPNMKVLICAGGLTPDENGVAQQWHHPTLREGGDGIYLYSANRLEKVSDLSDNMGDPDTLEAFLKFGEENFQADKRMIIFQNHGGLSAICYDDNFSKDSLTYDELKGAFSSVYGNSPEIKPFELVAFNACMTGSYELANTFADFSRYMMGAEPSANEGWDEKVLFGALAQNTSMTGAQIGKVICDSIFKNYDIDGYSDNKHENAFSVIDLSKITQLRTAYEAYFDEALKRSDEEGFLGAFARAAEARNVDRYSNLYTDLGLLAKNTKSIMPKNSANLLKAIDNAVVYNKRGKNLKGKGISTYYPYISSENTFLKLSGTTNSEITAQQFEENILGNNSNYNVQKEFYQKLMVLDFKNMSDDNAVPLEINSNNHFVTKLTPEQLGNISSAYCVLLPVKEGDSFGLSTDFGGAILASVEDLKIDWKKGTVTENFRAVEPMFDGHKIIMLPLLSGRGHTLYKVPVIWNDLMLDLIVRYDTPDKKYSILGFGEMVENGVIRLNKIPLQAGQVITPIHMVLSDNPSDEQIGISGKNEQGEPIYSSGKFSESVDPNTGKTVYINMTKGTPFVYTHYSTITNSPIKNADYLYAFVFRSPGGDASLSQPGIIHIEHGKITKLTLDQSRTLAE